MESEVDRTPHLLHPLFARFIRLVGATGKQTHLFRPPVALARRDLVPTESLRLIASQIFQGEPVMKALKVFFILLPFVLLCAVAAQSRQNMISQERATRTPPDAIAQPKEERQASENIRLAVDLVVLDAMVLEQKTGRVVGSLKREDLTVFEDGIQQQITHFSQDSLPLSVILLIDRGGCLDPFSETMRRATLEALRRLRPQDEIALMTFHDKVELVKSFGSAKDDIASSILRVPDHDEEAGHCFNRAFHEAARYMKAAANPDGRRVIIMITGATRAFDCPGPAAEETRLAVLESGSVVCGLIPKTAAQRIENSVMVAAAGIGGMFKMKSSNLKQLAEETGSEIMSDKPENIDRAFNNLVDHLRTRYSIGFVSTNSKRDGSLRKLKLDVAQSAQQREGRLVVKTRRGYVAPRAGGERPGREEKR
jgi:VWFA-related protein